MVAACVLEMLVHVLTTRIRLSIPDSSMSFASLTSSLTQADQVPVEEISQRNFFCCGQ
jgi:hypothetical protein